MRSYRVIIALLLISGLLITLIGVHLFMRELSMHATRNEPDVFVGVDIGYGDEEDVYTIANTISEYANLIILGSLNVTTDTAKLTRVCDYLYQKALHFIIFLSLGEGFIPRGPDPQFFNRAVNRYGDKFLGAYIFDEPGGKQMDYNMTNPDKPIHSAVNFTDAAQKYVSTINYYLSKTTQYYEPTNLRLFTSDYALYWFDYLSGYDVVFGQFVGNQSRQITVALCRGAAKALDKNWGIIITWMYQNAPFLENAGQLFLDMVLAYENGAKYIVVFNSPGKHPTTSEFGTLTPEHLETIKMFWDYVSVAPKAVEYPSRTAYVLPSDYGYGFRSPNDTIWGLWKADTLSSAIWNQTLTQLAVTQLDSDIVYETKIDDVPLTLPYEKLIFWNGTTIQK